MWPVTILVSGHNGHWPGPGSTSARNTTSPLTIADYYRSFLMAPTSLAGTLRPSVLGLVPDVGGRVVDSRSGRSAPRHPTRYPGNIIQAATSDVPENYANKLPPRSRGYARIRSYVIGRLTRRWISKKEG